MQKTNWLRLGLASMFVMAAGGSSLLTACGGDDEPGNNGNDASVDSDGGSSGNTDTDGSTDTDATTSSSSGDAGPPPPPPAALAVVHGYQALGEIKICYAIGAAAAPEVDQGLASIKPLPEGANGLPAGAGGILPSTGLDLSQAYIRPYLIKKDSIPTDAYSCADLIGDQKRDDVDLVLGTDYFDLEVIEKGTLTADSTFALIAHKASDAGSDVKPAYTLLKLDTTTAIADDKIGLQFINAGENVPSSGVAPFVDRPAAEQDGERTDEFFLGTTNDNPNKVTLASELAAAAIVNPFNPAETTAVGVQLTFGGGEVQILNATPGNATPPNALIPVGVWSGASDPTGQQKDAEGASLYFQPGHAFTFFFVGDVTSGNAASDLVRPHFLVFPNKPVASAL